MKQISIKVRRLKQLELNPLLEKNSDYVETIKRVPFNHGFVGNFVPCWCRYKGIKYLIHGSIDHAYMHGFDNDAYIVTD